MTQYDIQRRALNQVVNIIDVAIVPGFHQVEVIPIQRTLLFPG